jgi:hypothetical protein
MSTRACAKFVANCVYTHLLVDRTFAGDKIRVEVLKEHFLLGDPLLLVFGTLPINGYTDVKEARDAF